MTKWNMIVDVARCMGCFNCFLSSKDEHVDNAFPGYSAPQPLHGHRWIDIKTKERGDVPMVDVAYLPTMCNHCDDAPCVKAGEGAIRKRDDGIVLIDPDKARGRKDLVDSCPYGAIWWNEEEQLPQAWYFDAHLLDQGWKQPRCEQVCPTGALHAVKVEDSDMQALVEQESLEVLHPEYETRPRVYYKNLYRFTQCFIGGSLIASKDGVSDCVAGARITVRKNGEVSAETVSDEYGEFKCDRLLPDSGEYTVEIAAQGCTAQTLTVALADSVYLGTIELTSEG